MKKAYKILRHPAGVYFVCVDCGHEVHVNSFPQLRGVGMSRRTQAAAAMKKHRETHLFDPAKGTR